MGLLDSLFSGSGNGGGLLDGLLYPPTQFAPPPQKQYDALGNPLPDLIAPPAKNPWDSVALPDARPQAPAMPQMAAQPPIFAGSGMYGLPPQIGQQPAPAPAPPQQVAAQPPQPQPDAPNMVTGSLGSSIPVPTFGQPDPAQIPPNAQPAQYQPPAPQAAPDAGRPSLGDRLMAGLTNFGAGGKTGGLIGAIGGGIGGLSTGQSNDQTAVLQQQRKATYDALIQAKAPPQVAMAAALSKDVFDKVAPQYLGADKFQFQKVKGADGQETLVAGNTADGTVKPVNLGGPNGQAAPTGSVFDAINQAKDSGVTDPQKLYQFVPPAIRDGVQAMIEGRAIPTYLSSRGETRNTAIMLAHAIDPTFDETQIQARQQGNKDFYGGGKSAETMRKVNQSALHFGELTDKMQTLPGSSVPAANSVANFVNTNLLGKGNANNFNVNAHALADELSTMFKGVGISDAEIRAWESRLTPDMSDEQQRGMSKTLLGLYQDSVSALEKKRQESVGPVVAAAKGPILGPEATAALQKVENFANGKPTAPTVALTIQEGATATNPTTGQKITFRNGKWQ